MDADDNEVSDGAASDVEFNDADLTDESNDTDLTNESSDTDVSVASDDTNVTDFSDDDDPDMNDWIDLNPADHRVPFYQFQPDFRIPHNVVPHGPTWQPKDIFFATLSTNVASNLPYDRLLDSFFIENARDEDSKYPKNKYKLWKKIGRNLENITDSVFCGDCKARVGDEKKPTINCGCGSTGPDRPNENLHFFTHISIKAQLEEMLSLPNMVASLNYRNTRVKINGDAIEDIYDGRVYQEKLQGFLANPNNYSFTIWIDGLQLAKSSTEGATPVFLMVNEFSPHARKRHMILAGVFVGSGKPCLNEVLRPVINELENLYHEGITWTPAEGGEPRTSRFIVLILSCDSDARYDILNMTRFNGYYGCTFCYHPGFRIPGVRKNLYPRRDRITLRTNEHILACMEHAAETGQKVWGVKGNSIFRLLPEFDFSSGVVVDSFHSIYLGMGPRMTNVLARRSIEVIDIFIINILLGAVKMPTRISRHTRDFDIRARWKATEHRNWLLYTGPLILKDILPDDEHRLFMKLAEGVFLLHKTSITEEEINHAEELLNEVAFEFQEFGLDQMFYTVHLLLHITKSVRDNGPAWVYSGGIFEAWNRRIAESVTSPNDRVTQIVTRFLLRRFLEYTVVDGDLHPTAAEFVKKKMQKARWNVPPNVSTGRFFQGIPGRTPRNENAEPADTLAIEAAGLRLNQEPRFRRYNRANIHGAMYKEWDDIERGYCDYFVHSKMGFYICKKLVSFSTVDGEEMSGIIGIRLNTGDPIFDTSYIRPYDVDDNGLHFIPYTEVLTPAISMEYDRRTFIIPLANIWETD